MPTPAWQAATSGSSANAGQVNQFLGTHAITYVWSGVLQASQQTAGSGAPNSNGTWLAQKFTTAAGQAAVGWVQLYLQVTGSPSPWSVSVQAASGPAPSGTPLVTTAMPKEFLPSGSPGWRTIMLPVSGLTASATYWIVAQAQGDGSDYFAWSKSSQPSGASTSSNGTTWTAQSYGLMFQVFDATPVQPLAGTWEDSGARWTSLGYSGGLLSRVQEYTTGQVAGGYTASLRNLTWTDGTVVTGVA